MKSTFLIFNFFLLNILMFTMCDNNNRSNQKLRKHNSKNEIVNIDIDKLDVNKTLYFSSIFKDFKLIPLETIENSLIGQIDEVKIFEDTLYILDSNIGKAIFVFDMKGKFISKIGRIGKGPGEYILPLSFSIDTENRLIQILDRKKIIEYYTNGKLADEILLKNTDSPQYMEYWEGKTYIDHNMYSQRKSSYLLSYINSEGQSSKIDFAYQSVLIGFKQPINTRNHLIRTADGIKYAKPLLDTIYQINNNGLKPYLYLTTKNKLTTEIVNEMNEINDPWKFMDYFWKCKKFLGVRDYVENNSLILFRFQNFGNTNTLIYWPKKKKIECSKYPITDDVSFTTGYIRFYSTYNNYFVSVIENTNQKLNNFIENTRNSKINLSKENQQVIDKIKPDSNPIIVLYDCKE